MHFKVRNILITGGAGFIGSHFVGLAVKSKWKVTVVDKLTYAGDVARLRCSKDNIKFVKADICDRPRMDRVFKSAKPDTVVHFAAETHVDRSIKDVRPFIKTNIEGTQTLIELSRKYKVKRFIHISTDEVYGQSKTGKFKETAPLKPNNPYSATKAAAEMHVSAANHTFGFPSIIVRPANNYGPGQYPEKFIPVAVVALLSGRKIPVYGRGKQIREWLHVSDCAEGIKTILQKGKVGEVYNVGSYFEQKNLDTAKDIVRTLGKTQKSIKFVADRPGHDFRYSVDCAKLKKLGWRTKIRFQKGLKETVCWYQEHLSWARKKQNRT